MTKLLIDKGVPLPPRRKGGPPDKYPFPGMEVGDSFFAANYEDPRVMSNLAWKRGKKLGRKFSVRTEGDGVRVWRVK